MAITDAQVTFYGFWHLEGESVAVSILGLDLGDYTVAADGSVTALYGSDDGGLLTPAYVVAHTNSVAAVENNVTFNVTVADVTTSVTVPVVIGLTYRTRGQLLRPDTVADNKSPLGPGLGKTRRVHVYAAMVQDAVSLSFGTDFTHLEAAFFSDDGETARAEDSPFSGVIIGTLDDDYGFEGQLCWELTRPYACTIMATSVWLDEAER